MPLYLALYRKASLLRRACCIAGLVSTLLYTGIVVASTDTTATADDAMDVMGEFTGKEINLGPRAISTKQKHTILFFMGSSLLLLVLATAVLGISMAVYGKQVFMWHMISAGLTVTLALAHGITAVVWFSPF
ncbi:MAG: hypothetical protein JKY90_09395 [Gammaproteobacteria bacterium]|nr:hypothetical protein [Gammaproteobacteria bacterium]